MASSPRLLEVLNDFGVKLRQEGIEAAVVQLPGYAFSALEAYWKSICTFEARKGPATGPDGVRWTRSARLRTAGARLRIEEL